MKDELAGDAARIAGGSGIAFLGGIADRGIRWVVKWFLAGALGPAGLGVYQAALSVATVLTAFTPLGMDTGVVFFGARHSRSGDQARLRGTLLLGFTVSLVMGVLGAVGLTVAARSGLFGTGTDAQDLGQTIMWMAPVLVVWTPLLFCVGALRARKDMKSVAIAFQIGLPVALLTGMLVCVGLLDLGVPGAIGAFVVSAAVGLALALMRVWRHDGTLLRDRTIRPIIDFKDIFAFSIPQSLTGATFRLNLQMDILMLAWLADMQDVGLYTVAASLAAIGSMPSNAIASMFNPFIAELSGAGENERLDGLLKIVTRWLILAAVPVYLVLALLPEAALSIYDDAFSTAAMCLVVLSVGQLINTACAPTMRLIPMSGHTMLNLVNGLAALGLNVGLNYLLIPRMGLLGAAVATSTTLAAWSIWRLFEVWWLLRCFPFTAKSGLLLVIAFAGGFGVYFGFQDGGLLVRALGTFGVVAVFTAVFAVMGRTPEDREVIERIRKRIGGLRSR